MGLSYEAACALGIGHLHPQHSGATGGRVAAPPAPSPPARRSKYNAQATIYNGVRYDSKSEAKRAERLDADVEAGLIAWWIAQPKFRLGVPENVYVPDFLVVYWYTENDISFLVRVEDVKGQETPKFRRDRKLWERYGPCPLWIVRRGKVDEIITPSGT